MSAVEILDRETYPIEVCDERIRLAQVVLDHPERFERREFFDARRAHVKWTRRREAAIAWQQVKHAVEYLFDFAARMPDFWQHDLTGPARDVFVGPQFLGKDPPVSRCERCRRLSWSEGLGERCGMIQPDGTRCEGRMIEP